MYKKTRLKYRTVKEELARNPTISSLEEMLAVKGIDAKDVDPKELEAAKVMIERNRIRLQVLLKQSLYLKQDNKSKEILYKMICDPEELKRFGIKDKDLDVTKNMTIEIKSADPDIIDKVKDL